MAGQAQEGEAAESQLELVRKQREQEMALKFALQQLLEPAAFERLSNIRLSNSELYKKIASAVLQLYKSGSFRGKVSEEDLKKFASRFIAQRHEPEIKFLRK